MDVQLATSILVTAKEHKVFREDLPTEDEVRIDKAERIVRQAKAARNANVEAPAVQAVLGIYEANGSAASPTPQPPEPPAEEQAVATSDATEPSDPSPADQFAGDQDNKDTAPQGGVILPDEPAPVKPAPIEAMQAPRGGHNPMAPENAQWECADCDYAARTQTGLKRHLNKADHSMIPVTERDEPKEPSAELRAALADAEDPAGGRTGNEVMEAAQEQAEVVVEAVGTPIKIERPAGDKAPLHEAIEYVHTERALQKIGAMRLPKPQEFEGDPPQRPTDLTALNPLALRQLYSSFNACSAYARYHLALEEARADDVKRILARRKSQVIDGLNPLDGKGKPKTVTALENEAFNTSHELQSFADKQADHLATAKVLRAMLESYDMDCQRISREMANRLTESTQS